MEKSLLTRVGFCGIIRRHEEGASIMKDVKAAVDAILDLDLGTWGHPENTLRLYDLIPEAWIGAYGESRNQVAAYIAEAMVHAVMAAPDVEEWEPTMELRVRMIYASHFDTITTHITEQKFIRVSGGPSWCEDSVEWRPLPMVDGEGEPLHAT